MAHPGATHLQLGLLTDLRSTKGTWASRSTRTGGGKVGWVADVGVAATIAAEVSRRRLVLNLLFGRRQENDPALEIYPSSMRVVLGL